MKKMTILSLSLATVLFTACGEDVKKHTEDIAAAASERLNASAAEAAAAAKEKAAEMTSKVRAEAEKAAAAVKEKAAAVVAETTETVKAEANKAVAAVKEKVASVTGTATETVAKTAETAKETVTAKVETAKEVVVEKVAAKVETAKEATPAKVEAAAGDNKGQALFAKCAGCHGKDGKSKALGKSAIIAGQPVADLEASLAAYKEGTRNVAGMGTLMKGQVSSMSADDIKAVSSYISGLK